MIPPDIEADCRELVWLIDKHAAFAFCGLPTDSSEVDKVAKRLLARGFPVSAFVREVLIRRYQLDPEKPR